MCQTLFAKKKSIQPKPLGHGMLKPIIDGQIYEDMAKISMKRLTDMNGDCFAFQKGKVSGQEACSTIRSTWSVQSMRRAVPLFKNILQRIFVRQVPDMILRKIEILPGLTQELLSFIINTHIGILHWKQTRGFLAIFCACLHAMYDHCRQFWCAVKVFGQTSTKLKGNNLNIFSLVKPPVTLKDNHHLYRRNSMKNLSTHKHTHNSE